MPRRTNCAGHHSCWRLTWVSGVVDRKCSISDFDASFSWKFTERQRRKNVDMSDVENSYNSFCVQFLEVGTIMNAKLSMCTSGRTVKCGCWHSKDAKMRAHN